MSDSQAYEEITVSSDGVRVVKRFEEDEFPVPAIAFDFLSDRDEEVTVGLSDTVPEGIEVEDLGFHPEYGSEYWTIDEDTIRFEHSLGAGATYTTVYGIRATGSDDVEQFLTAPTLDTVDPPLPDDQKEDDLIPESGDDVVKDAIAGEGEIPGLEEEDEEEDEDVATLDLKNPNEAGQVPAGAGSADDGATAEGEEATTGDISVEGGSVVGMMAAEIRQQNVSADDVKLIRRAFEVASQDGGATAAKIEQLQTDIADLRAYTNAIEEFLDDNGTAEQMIGEFESELDAFSGQLDELQSELDANSSELDAVSSDVDSMSDDVDAVSEEIDSLGVEVAAVSSDVDSMSDDVDAVSEEVDSLGEEMNTLGDEVDSVGSELVDVSSDVDSMADQMAALSDAIEDVESDVARLEEEVAGDDVSERLETIESNLGELQDWQEQIKKTFGG